MGEHKVWVDEDGFIRATIIGSHEKESAKNIINELNKQLKKMGENGLVLIDMTKTGRPTYEARKLHANNIKLHSDLFKKAALYGASALNKVMANFIIKASGKGKKVKYFNTKDEAIKWLKQ